MNRRREINAAPAAWQRRDWVWALILVLAIVAAYSPVWYAGFIWDDDDHVTNNPTIIGPLGLKEIWTTGAARYYPLVLSTFWVEHALWGLNPLFYHLVNVAMHAAAALVLWRVLFRLGAPGAWLGAAQYCPVKQPDLRGKRGAHDLKSGSVRSGDVLRSDYSRPAPPARSSLRFSPDRGPLP